MEKIVENFGISKVPIFTDFCIETKKKDKEIIEEMISKVDRNSFDNLIRLASVGGKVKGGLCDDWLRKWAEAKYEFYLLFGNSLSYSAEVEETISDDKIMAAVNNVVNSKTVTTKVDGEIVEKDVSHFVVYKKICLMFSAEDYINNRCPKNEILEKYCSEYYKPGMKLTKFFSSYFQDNLFDIEISKVMQNKKTIGRMTVSIDPIDYLTSAINKNNWTTCQSLYTGCHANGPIPLMFDENTTVCFKSNGKVFDYSIGGHKFKANSKQFRSFVYVDKKTLDFVIARAYPNSSDETLYKTIKNFMQSAIDSLTNDHGDWYAEVVTRKMTQGDCNGEYILTNNDLVRVHRNKNKNYTVPNGALCFLDPNKYICSKNNGSKNLFHIGVKNIECIRCGKPIATMCENKYIYCGECGD